MGDTDWSNSMLKMGYLSAIGSMVCSALSASCTQALEGAVPDFQLSALRATGQATFFAVFGLITRSDLNIELRTIPELVYLGVAYTLLNIGLNGATVYLPLIEVYGVLSLGTMVTAFLYSRLMFNGDVPKCGVISAFICVVGIILIIQPPWLFHHNMTYSKNASMTSFENTTEDLHTVKEFDDNGTTLGYTLAAIGGVGFGLIYDISGITLKIMRPLIKALYATSFCTVTSVIFMLYLEDPVLMLNPTQWMLVSGHVVLSAGSTFLTIQGAHYAPGPSLSALYCLELIMVFVCQYTFMHSIQPGNYNWIEVLGCFVIVFGASIPPVVEVLAKRARDLM